MFDLFTEEIRRDPFPFYEQMRRSSPLLAVPNLNLWMVFDYDGVKRVLADHEAFSSSMFTAGRANPDWFFFFDPPRHTKLRALVSRAFTPGVVAALEPRVRELAGELLDRAMERGEMDMAADFAVPLPMMVIAEMLGVSVSEQERFHRWSHAMMNLSYSVSGGGQAEAAAQAWFTVHKEMSGYLEAQLEERRATPRSDLLTGLVHAEVEGEHLSHHEILGFFQLLLVAGSETTTNLLNNAILCWDEHRGELARLRSSPELLPSAIEEVLRYRSPIQWFFRATKHAVEMQGQTIPAGTLVIPVIGSANRDPRHFADPERFDIGRDANPHLAFGHGIHFCIGAALSRLEARVGLAEFLRRVEGFETAGQWRPRQAIHVHGPVSLPIRFTRARDAAGSH